MGADHTGDMTAPQLLPLTADQEMPYGDMDAFAVTWLVGKHGMKLHIPDDCPHAFSQVRVYFTSNLLLMPFS